MTDHNFDDLAAAVAARVIEALPRGRLPITPEYLSADQVAQMTGFSPKWLEARRADRTGAHLSGFAQRSA